MSKQSSPTTPDVASENEPTPPPPVTMGRIVHYRLSEDDVRKIAQERARVDHAHNIALPGNSYPATVVRVWSPACCNLQVHLDGPDVHWVTSAVLGEDNGQWQWPPRA